MEFIYVYFFVYITAFVNIILLNTKAIRNNKVKALVGAITLFDVVLMLIFKL